MKQVSFAQVEYQNKKKVTHRERLLAQMEALVPWQRLIEKILEEINASLAEKGLFMREGTIIDATIVAAAPSTKHQAKQRDPEMRQTKKGNQWYFGMKVHIGVDSVTGLTHSVVATSANVADITMVGHSVGDGDPRVYGDAGYTGMWKYLEEEQGVPDSRCCFAAKRGPIKKMEDSPMKTLLAIEKAKASIRAKVEHPFHVIKNLFGYREVLYKGLVKNQAQLFSLFGLANLVLATRCESRVDGGSAP